MMITLRTSSTAVLRLPVTGPPGPSCGVRAVVLVNRSYGSSIPRLATSGAWHALEVEEETGGAVGGHDVDVQGRGIVRRGEDQDGGGLPLPPREVDRDRLQRRVAVGDVCHARAQRGRVGQPVGTTRGVGEVALRRRGA